MKKFVTSLLYLLDQAARILVDLWRTGLVAYVDRSAIRSSDRARVQVTLVRSRLLTMLTDLVVRSRSLWHACRLQSLSQYYTRSEHAILQESAQPECTRDVLSRNSLLDLFDLRHSSLGRRSLSRSKSYRIVFGPPVQIPKNARHVPIPLKVSGDRRSR